jgi:uncharacterized protein YerC
MPRASRRPVSKNVLEEIQDTFSYLISSLASPKDIQTFFDSFLTEEEKTMLTKRLMLHLMIENSYDPMEIMSALSLSKETINKHKHILLRENIMYKDIIAKITKRKKTKAFWEKIEKAFRPLELALDAKTNMKARAKFLSGDYE